MAQMRRGETRDMLHFELIPWWMLPALGCLAIAPLLYRIGRMVIDRQRLADHRRTRRRDLARHRAWNWIMGRRTLQLTDQRQPQRTGKG
ncbi:hypothetical protein ACPVPU_00655 [Sphingomonas sp. CJ99]